MYRRMVAKSKSVYPWGEALHRDGSEKRRRWRIRRKRWKRSREREKAASANVTGLHSDVGVQRLHRRASCTNVHARAHTLILGVRRPLPACKTVTHLHAIRSIAPCGEPQRRVAMRRGTCVDADETTSRRIVRHKAQCKRVASKMR